MGGLTVVTEYAGRLRFSALRALPASLLLFVGPEVFGLPDFVGQVGALLEGKTLLLTKTERIVVCVVGAVFVCHGLRCWLSPA